MEKDTFSKKDTAAIKGIAIMLMLFHHCFLQGRYSGFDISFFPVSESVVNLAAKLGKCCVGIFTFLSAYGISCSYLNIDRKLNFTTDQCKTNIKRRLINLMSGFFFAYIVAFIGSCIFGPTPLEIYGHSVGSVYNAIIDILGIADIMGLPSLIGTWWYMGLALIVIFSMPLALKAYKYLGGFLIITYWLAFCALGIPVSDYSCWFLLIPTGIWCADKKVLDRIREFQYTKNNSNINFFLRFSIISLVCIIVIIPRMFIESEYMLMLFDVFLTISVVVWSYLFIIRIPWLGDLLQFLGKHSMNIFLLHSFIRGSWFYEWTYSRGHFMIIWIILLLESLMLSVVVEKFKNLIGYNKFIDKIQKKIILM